MEEESLCGRALTKYFFKEWTHILSVRACSGMSISLAIRLIWSQCFKTFFLCRRRAGKNKRVCLSLAHLFDIFQHLKVGYSRTHKYLTRLKDFTSNKYLSNICEQGLSPLINIGICRKGMPRKKAPGYFSWASVRKKKSFIMLTPDQIPASMFEA